MYIHGSRRPNVVPITAPSFPTPPQPRVYRKIAYTFAAFTVLIVVGVLWLSSVRAEIIIKVKKSSVTLDTSIGVAKSPATGELPGRVVKGTFDSGIREFPVTEATSTENATVTPPAATSTAPAVVPTLPVALNTNVTAKGTVRIINKYSRAQTLVKTTRLLTADNKLYRLDKTVNVPANSELKVTVTADKPGSQFVIAPTQFTIPGLWIDLQKYIYAVSDEAFTGGETGTAVAPTPVAPTAPVAPAVVDTSAKPKKVVTQAMLDAAESSLKDAAFEQAKQTLAAEITDTKFTAPVYFTQIVERKFNVKANQAADALIGSIKLEVTAVYYSPDDMSTFIRSQLKEKLPEGREFLPFNDQSVKYTLDTADVKNEKATVHVIADAEYRLTTASPALQKSAMAGRNKDEVVTTLKALEGVEDVQVNLKPSWLTKIPTLQDHIDVVIQ